MAFKYPDKAMEEALEALTEKLGVILDVSPNSDVVTTFQAMLLFRRGTFPPSKEDFEMGRTIAWGITVGISFAKKYPELTEDDILAIAAATKIAVGQAKSDS